MLNARVGLASRVADIKLPDLVRVANALSVQASRDLAPRWSVTATVTAISRLHARILDREEFLAAVTGSPESVESADAVISARLQVG